MRIAVCGTHGIGKTTLSKKLSEAYSLPFLSEQASNLLKTKYPFLETEKDFELFKDFQREVLLNQKTEEEKYQNTGFVADRTLLDSLAYVHIRTLIERDFGEFLKEYLTEVYIGKPHRRYDKIIFIRYHSEFLSSNDEIRNLNPVFMEEIDRFLDYFFLKYAGSFNVLYLNSLDFNERVQQSLEFIQGKIV